MSPLYRPDSPHENSDPATPVQQRLGRIGLEKSTELAALVGSVAAGLHTAFYGVGLLTHASREQLLGLGAPLTYPLQSALLTSLSILWSTPIHALWAVVSGEIWVLALVVIPLPLMVAWSRDAPAWRAVVGHLLCLLLLIVAVRLYQAALYPRLQAGKVAPDFSAEAEAAWTSQIEREVISWLQNSHSEHPGRRKALAGIAGWLLTFAGGFAWLAWQRRTLSHAARRGLAFAHVLVAVAVLGLIPRAYVMATWGTSYPRVQLREGEDCDSTLRQALQGSCCLYDVSAGGSPRTTLQVGDACPDGTGFRAWSDKEARCFLLRGIEEVSYGCQ